MPLAPLTANVPPTPPTPPAPPAPPVLPGAGLPDAGSAQAAEPLRARPRRLGPALIGGAAALVACAVVAAILVSVGVVSVGSRGAGSAQGARIEGPGYPTATAAAQAYLTAMTRADVPAMISTFAVETYGEHADGAQMIQRLNAFNWVADPALPHAALNDQLNAQWHLGQMTRAIYGQDLVLSDPTFQGNMITVGPTADGQNLADAAAISTYVATTFDGTAFAGITSATLIDWQSAYPQLAAVFAKEQNTKNVDVQARMYGADELAYQVADLQTKHGEYLLFLQLNRYGDRWWVGSFYGNLGSIAGTDSLGGGLMPAGGVK